MYAHLCPVLYFPYQGPPQRCFPLPRPIFAACRGPYRRPFLDEAQAPALSLGSRSHVALLHSDRTVATRFMRS